MTILHIARIGNNFCHGVSVVVPKHVMAQQKFETVGLINVSGFKYDEIKNQFEYTEPFSLDILPQPFNHPDLVVFHEVYRVQYLKIYKYLVKNNIPYIIVPHCELTKGAQKKKWLKKKVANFVFFSKFIKNAKSIQCLSQVELSDTKFGNNNFVATNGINIASERKEKFSQSGLKFLYIGRIETYQKGLDLLVKALSKIKSTLQKENCKFYIFGPQYKSRCGQLDDLIKKYGVETVTQIGDKIFGNEKKSEYLSADVFIQTSRFEGMPMGILEAMSYGLPCIVTEGTTLANFVLENNAGWACETDAQKIAETILKAISEKDELSAKSDNAYKAAQNNFNWDAVADSTLTYYKTMLE